MRTTIFKTLLSDFSRVILFPKDTLYLGGLNAVHRELQTSLGEEYNLFEHFVLNQDLLHFYASLHPQYSVNLFTTDIIQNHPLLRPKLEIVFENIFAANDYGLDKKNPTAYSFIAEKLAVLPEEVVFIDDQEGNIEAAKQAGMATVLYDNNNDVIRRVTALLV
jgi:FMN phosphatase YigB (HAD superfamily)